ncbi:MAG TPA: polysaccharide deacetylase [Selenomonas sp.]|nr:polysaccharide deacetylase [Selenomonas sp.]
MLSKGFWKMSLVLRLCAVIAVIVSCVLFAGKSAHIDAESVQDIEQGQKVMVLNYHKVDNSFNSLAIPPSDFEAQMQFLEKNGYHTISPDELYNALTEGGALPQNPVLITFDDGYVDNYTNAFPILKKYNMKATIFVVPGFTNVNKNYLTWDQMLEMEQNGITIESHTMNHKPLEGLSDDQIIAELKDSKQRLEARLGHPVEYLAYPTGTYNLHIASIAKEVGYRGAFTVKYGNVDMGSNVYALERVPIFRTEHTMRDFYERLQYRPLVEQFGWTKN